MRWHVDRGYAFAGRGRFRVSAGPACANLGAMLDHQGPLPYQHATSRKMVRDTCLRERICMRTPWTRGISTRRVFPAEQGKNREILSFFSGSLGFRRSLRPKFKHLLPVSLSLGAGKYMTPNREFSSAIRESWNWFFEGSSPEIQFRSM